MAFADWFSKENVVLDLEGGDKLEVFEELVQRLVDSKAIPKTKKKTVLQCLMDRESLGSTGIGHGVGIPHAKIPGLKQVHTCVGIHREGVDYSAVDGEPVHIIMLILRPEENVEEHLSFLQWISKLGRNPDFRSFIRQSKSEREVIGVLEEMSNL